ncbi:MAG: YlxR family protein [Clostridiales bacterium]|jgi:predicted RNA-binding protein YlxR (DUF448 family)|nr:YlxR family protein [Clostridiales bacterium]
MKQKRRPQRMCIACRSMKDKFDLVRLVKTPDGSVALDATGKMPGRGAYICKAQACAEMARKQRKIERCFEVKDAGDAYAGLGAAIQADAARGDAPGSSDGAGSAGGVAAQRPAGTRGRRPAGAQEPG